MIKLYDLLGNDCQKKKWSLGPTMSVGDSRFNKDADGAFWDFFITFYGAPRDLKRL